MGKKRPAQKYGLHIVPISQCRDDDFKAYIFENYEKGKCGLYVAVARSYTEAVKMFPGKKADSFSEDPADEFANWRLQADLHVKDSSPRVVVHNE